MEQSRWTLLAKILRRLFLYPLLVIAGCHTLMTGSPLPLRYIEELDSPVDVKAVTSTELVLENGQSVRLKYIDTIPEREPVSLESLKHGVEVHANGDVIGLIPVNKICGNDPVWYRLIRVNVRDLAAVLAPSNISESAVNSDQKQMLLDKRKQLYFRENRSVDVYFFSAIRTFRIFLNDTAGVPVPEDSVKGERGTHDLRSGGLVV